MNFLVDFYLFFVRAGTVRAESDGSEGNHFVVEKEGTKVRKTRGAAKMRRTLNAGWLCVSNEAHLKVAYVCIRLYQFLVTCLCNLFRIHNKIFTM